MNHKSKHAIARQQQRGIPNSVLDVILKFGAPSNKPGGAYSYFITRAEANRIAGRLKKLISVIERANGIEVIQSNSDTTLTVYHKR